METDPFEGLSAFLAVSRHRSFTRAAATMGITPTALSKKIKLLEARHGTVLFQRTTRRVALTEAGAALLARVGPATTEIADAVSALGQRRDVASGTLHLTVPRAASLLLVHPLVTAMRRAHPQVQVEISLDDAKVDLIEGGFDAGIRLGDDVEKDMVAVRLTKDLAWSIVGAPSYFAEHGHPRTPEALVSHQAIRQRMKRSGTVYRWELTRRGRDVTVDVPGGLVVDDVGLLVRFACDGLGLAYVPDHEVIAELADGRLERTLESFLRPGPGLYLYFPARMQVQSKVRALVEMASEVFGRGGSRAR